jgi:hypothetical protein
VLVRFHLLVTDNREVWKSNKFCCKMVVQRGFPPLSVRLVTYTLEEAPRFLQPSARLMVMNQNINNYTITLTKKVNVG